MKCKSGREWVGGCSHPLAHSVESGPVFSQDRPLLLSFPEPFCLKPVPSGHTLLPQSNTSLPPFIKDFGY